MKKYALEYKNAQQLKDKLKIRESIAAYQNETIFNIGYERICKCPPNKLNCLTAKDWIKFQVAVWEFYYEKRDLRVEIYLSYNQTLCYSFSY